MRRWTTNRDRYTRALTIGLVLAQLGSIPNFSPCLLYAAPLKLVPKSGYPQTSRLAALRPHTENWLLYPSFRFLQDFSSLSNVPTLTESEVTIQALRRTLHRSGIVPGKIVHEGAGEQLESIRNAVRSVLGSLSKEDATADVVTEEGLAHATMRDNNNLATVRDLRQAIAILSEAEQSRFRDSLIETEKKLERQRLNHGSQLVRNAIASEKLGTSMRWDGRTAYIPLDGGTVLAIKHHLYNGEDNEHRMMGLSHQWGVDSPIPLPQLDPDGADNSYIHPQIVKESPGLVQRYNKIGEGGNFSVSLIPSHLANAGLSYLNEQLSHDMSRDEKIEIIENAAHRAVDHMLILHHNGHASDTLMAISHEGVDQGKALRREEKYRSQSNNKKKRGTGKHEWDYWRWNMSFLGGIRYGPTHINNWIHGFRYPNLRLSGLWDPEHYKPWEELEDEHYHADHGGKIQHDAYSLGSGANISELAMILLDAGRINGLGEATVRIVASAINRYLSGLLPPEVTETVGQAQMSGAIQKSSHRMGLFARIWPWLKIPQFAYFTLISAAIVSVLFNVGTSELQPMAYIIGPILGPIAFMFWYLMFKDGNQPLALRALPGWVFHPLIMDAVKPAIELLRSHRTINGAVLAGHPSSSTSAFTMRVTFLGVFVYALILPAMLSLTTALAAILLLIIGGILVPMSWAVYAALVGLLLFPLRLLLQAATTPAR